MSTCTASLRQHDEPVGGSRSISKYNYDTHTSSSCLCPVPFSYNLLAEPRPETGAAQVSSQYGDLRKMLVIALQPHCLKSQRDLTSCFLRLRKDLDRAGQAISQMPLLQYRIVDHCRQVSAPVKLAGY